MCADSVFEPDGSLPHPLVDAAAESMAWDALVATKA